MRTLIAETLGQPATFDTPIEAIRAAREADAQYRTVEDRAVAGQTIAELYWDERTLALELSGGSFLNVKSCMAGVACALSGAPLVDRRFRVSPRTQIRVVLDGYGYVWRQGELASRYASHQIAKLHFMPDTVLIYVRQLAILQCRSLLDAERRSPFLFWSELE